MSCLPSRNQRTLILRRSHGSLRVTILVTRRASKEEKTSRRPDRLATEASRDRRGWTRIRIDLPRCLENVPGWKIFPRSRESGERGLTMRSYGSFGAVDVCDKVTGQFCQEGFPIHSGLVTATKFQEELSFVGLRPQPAPGLPRDPCPK